MDIKSEKKKKTNIARTESVSTAQYPSCKNGMESGIQTCVIPVHKPNGQRFDACGAKKKQRNLRKNTMWIQTYVNRYTN
jgi:hypothetical protein